ncbi:TetR family transcriptional regulator C-terminal domain-containing protein [Spongiivirga citrea]|uniref:TetR/AcrR family transcriptional regulator n=1 Tax=Spongiivirga citrea TaxID=1481457 RepID=A0A6M0CPX6_9FLAO|nr:TetR family transcriptional regulator C-terminal domain-containing protein [Spongiivirga citrea]NER17919.1 TetR/AcrR family transcriptional regulator [Spongiivirga citrea]
MATRKANKTNTEDNIITMYMEFVLENEHAPKSIYKFCKEQKINEADFYKKFGSFESLKSRIWERFYDVTLDLAHKDSNYESMSNKDKMLTFYYTFFEMLTANRSYVLFELSPIKEMLKNAKQLSTLRKKVKEFAGELIESANDEKQLRITKQPVSLFSEGAWVQLLFLLQFWINDSSAGFEKTDAAIEKSVRTVFDLFDTSTIDSVIDLGKFLWKERMI